MQQETHANSTAWPGKREVPTNAFEFPEAKKMKFGGGEYSRPPVPAVARVVLNPADCDLDLDIKEDGLLASALYEQGFAYCWSGARANVGVHGGRYCFGCKIVAAQPVDMDDTPLDQQHLCRLGISRGDDPVGNLGETLHSFGFGGTGKFSNARIFSGYGETFGVGDTIICCVDLESKPMASIGFSKNGKWLGIAKQFDAGPGGLGVVDSPLRALPWESAVFPHVLLKNVIVQMQFSTEDGLVPQEGYRPWAFAIQERKMMLGPTFPNSSDCEVIMMVGLPASGKTTWAESWVRAHPEKRYILLGTNLALDQMKVPGLQRKHNYGERFDHLMDRATGIFNTLLSRSSKMPRNFIIDQTNVYKSARKRKLKPFADYYKIAVVVFPRPEEMQSRAYERFREMGKEVPAEAMNEMLANYILPRSKDMNNTDEYFDEVWFPELSRDEAQQLLDEMKANLSLKTVDASNSSQSFGKDAEPYTSPFLQNQGSLPGVHGQRSSSFSTQPPAGAAPTCYNLASSGYFGNNFNQYETNSGSNSRNVYQSGISYPHPNPSPYLGINYNPPDTYSGCHHFDKNENESRFAAQGSMNEQSYGVGYAYSHPSVGSGNLLPQGASDFNKYETSSWSHDNSRNGYQSGISYPESSPSPYLGINYNLSETYSRPHHFDKNYNDSRFSAQGSMNELYRSYGVGNTHSRPSVVSGNLLPQGAPDFNSSQMIEDHQLPVFPYNTGNLYASQSSVLPHLSPTRTSTFGRSTPTRYGCPFGSPLQGPPHGSFLGDTQHTQGSVPPHPG